MVKYRNLSLAQVQKLAEKIAKRAKKSGAVIGLSGNLGSGKTTFAKAFAKSLGIKAIKSPTFIVSQRYRLKTRYLYHLDFYRLDHQTQLQPLGLNELLIRPNIVLIEWVEKFPKVKGSCDILINLSVKPKDKRDVTIKSN